MRSEFPFQLYKRFNRILGIGLVFAMVAFATYTYSTKWHVSQKPSSRLALFWWKEHKRLKNELKSGSFSIMFLGDSITHGWSNEGKETWKAFYESRNAINYGVGGDRTQNVLYRIQDSDLKNQPNLRVVVLLIGTNNLKDNSVDEIFFGVAEIIAFLRREVPNAKILLLGILPRCTGDEADIQKQSIKKVNSLLKTLADQEVIFFLDLGGAFLKNGVIEKSLMPDGLHPNRKGYQRIAETIEPILQEVISSCGKSP